MSTLSRACAVLATMGAAAAGCFLVTGGTSGYALAPPEGGICTVDAASLGVTLACACGSSADCADGGAKFCCFGLTGATSAASVCQKDPCDAAVGAQLCQATSECVDAACVEQRRTYSGVSVPIHACGSLPGCTP